MQPIQERANAAGCEGHAGVGTSIIEVDTIAIRADGLAAREDYVTDVAYHLVHGLRPEDPLVAPQQAMLRPFEIEQCKP